MAINSIVVDPNNNSTSKANLTLVLATGLIAAIYEPREDLVPGYDFADPTDLTAVEIGSEIEWDLETGYPTNEQGEIYTYHAVGIRGVLKRVDAGDMHVNISVIPLDNLAPVNPNVQQLVESSPVKMYNQVVGDVVAEKARIRINGKNSVFLNKLLIFVSKKAEVRPRV